MTEGEDMRGGKIRNGFYIQYQFKGGEIGYNPDKQMFGCFYGNRTEQASSFISALKKLSEMSEKDVNRGTAKVS